jgi:Flp pilus assembly secretin CpaC
MKIDALGSGSIDSIPILNNRSFTSTIAIPSGQTALMASAVTRNEARDIEGIPGLSELPGFQGTEKSAEIDSDELLITITPHVVRTGRFRVTSIRILVDHTPTASE